jgi:hypothetical protein
MPLPMGLFYNYIDSKQVIKVKKGFKVGFKVRPQYGFNPNFLYVWFCHIVKVI